MKILTRLSLLGAAAAAVALAPSLARTAEGPAAPPAADPVLARVNGEPITLDQLIAAVDSIHAGPESSGIERPRQDPGALLERLIAVKLVAQEAREMGLDERRAFREDAALFRRNTLIDLTLRERAKSVAPPDAATVEARYRVLAGEAKLDALFFETAFAVEAFRARVAAGASFEDEAPAAVAAGTARGGLADDYTPLEQLATVLAEAALSLAPGELSAPVSLEDGFALLRLVDLRSPDDPAARRRATRETVELARLKAVGAYTAELRARYAKLDDALLEATDFNATGERLEALRADARGLVTIEGGETITVGDLTQALANKVFHGFEQAAEAKKIDDRKYEVLNDLILKRVVPLEGARLEIDRGEEFLAAVRVHEEEKLFSAAIRTAVMPEVRVEEADVARFYEEHKQRLLAPQTVRLESLAFAERQAAEAALERLRRGADWQWTVEHAPGQVDPEARAGLIDFRAPRPVDTLPEGLRGEVEVAAVGDYLLYAPEAGPGYVIAVRDRPAPQPYPLERVRAGIEGRLREESAQRALEAWVAQLRQASEVEVLVAGDELAAMVRRLQDTRRDG